MKELSRKPLNNQIQLIETKNGQTIVRKKNIKILLIIALVIFFAILGLIFVFSDRYSLEKVALVNKDVETTHELGNKLVTDQNYLAAEIENEFFLNCISKENLEISGWRDCQSETNGFSLSYPNEAILLPSFPGGPDVVEVTFRGEKDSGYNIAIWRMNELDILFDDYRFEDYLKELHSQSDAKPLATQTSHFQAYQAVKKYVWNEIGNQDTIEHYFVNVNNVLYRISVNLIGTEAEKKNFRNISDQILKSIKLVEKHTEEWKLYENNEHMFSVEYPPSWELVENKSEQIVVGFRKNPPNNPDLHKYTDIYFQIISNPKNLSLENFYKNMSETSEMALPNPFKMGAKYLEVDGKRAAKIIMPGAVFTEEVAVDLSGKILVIARYLDGNGKSIDEETEQVFNQMISLIKFTQ